MKTQYLFEKTVFLFGAGVSKDAGCFLSKEMLSNLKQSIPKDKKLFSDIYDFITQSLIYQYALKEPESKVSEVTNIEDFVLVLQQIIDREYIIPPPLIGNWNNKFTLWESQNKDVFQEFRQFIYDRLINKWTQFNSKKADILLKPFKKLIESSESFNVQMFSLNYDTMFEKVFNNEHEHLIDIGFSQNQWDGDFTNPESPAKLKLYKLHGSVDWYFDKEKEIIKSRQINNNPLVIFGSGSKIQSYDPFLSLLGTFSETLKKSVNLFVVIGYSFQDRYINNILIQNLSADVNKKMLVVDPNISEDKSNFINKIERFQGSKSMHEIISLTKINPDKIEIDNSKSIDFFKQYLEDDCKKLKDTLEDIEKGDSIF